MEENSKSPPKRKSNSEIAENSGKKQKTNDSTESREKSQNEVRPAEIEEDEVIFKSADVSEFKGDYYVKNTFYLFLYL